jgi:hypothetical protein
MPSLDLLAQRDGGSVERDPERSDLVVAGDGHRLPEVPLRHAPGRVLHPPEGSRHAPAHEEPDHDRHRERQERPGHHGRADQCSGLVDLAGRQREPEHRSRAAFSLEWNRHVQEVAADGRAPAHVAADPTGQRPAHLRALGVVLDLPHGVPVGLGQDPAVGPDHGDPPAEHPRVALGARLDRRRPRGAIARGRERVLEEASLGDEGPLEARH